MPKLAIVSAEPMTPTGTYTISVVRYQGYDIAEVLQHVHRQKLTGRVVLNCSQGSVSVIEVEEKHRVDA